MKNNISYFAHNISYLFKRLLKHTIVETDQLDNKIKVQIDREIIKRYGHLLFSNIKEQYDAIDLLITTNKSISRIGDGEVYSMIACDIPFQEGSEQLKNRLYDVVKHPLENLIIGLPKIYFSDHTELHETYQGYAETHGKLVRDILLPYIKQNVDYCDTNFTVTYQRFDNDEAHYYEEFRKIWQNKDLVIICGDNVFKEIKFNIYDNAKSIEYIYCLSSNAFSQYDSILARAKQLSKDKLIIAILGPTATVLAYDLCKEGYRCLDLGHIAKSYDWFNKNKKLNSKDNIESFFAPD